MITTNNRTEYLTRDAILKLLTDEENARVSLIEDTGKIPDGEEYVDLDHPSLGVLRMAAGTTGRTSQFLPKTALSGETWDRIRAKVDPGLSEAITEVKGV